MAFVPTNTTQFPTVPRLSGVPDVLRKVNLVQNSAVLLAADALSIIKMFLPSRWGIYLNGLPWIIPDSIVEVEYRQEDVISNAPQEPGSFVSYNKVASPAGVRVRAAKGGSVSERQNFLNNINATENSLLLLSVVTPEAAYSSMNLVHFDLRRVSHEGISRVLVDMWFQEVRVVATAQFSNTKSVSAQDPVDQGQLQSTPVDAGSAPPTPDGGAGSGSGTGTGAGSGSGSGGSGGTSTSGGLPSGWHAEYQPGDTSGSTTMADGTVVDGYHPPGLYTPTYGTLPDGKWGVIQ